MAAQTPLIIVIAGAGRGRSMPLQHPISIGRGEDNVLAISDPALSRHHCRVDAGADGPVIRDLESKNGVFVNGCPVSERVLADGDQIRIGDTALLVVLPRPAAASAGTMVAMVNTPVLSTSTIAIEPGTSPYLHGDVVAAGPAVARPAANLQALLMLSDALQVATTTAALFEALLSHAMDAFGAELTAIVARAETDEAFGVIVARTGSGSHAAVNGGLAARAISERSAILAHDEPAMCAPLMGAEPLTEALFVARPSNRGPFSVDDLQVLAAIGTIGGIALDRVRHLEWLVGENRRLQTDLAADHNLIGESAAMKAVHRFISRVAATDATVLLRGESGTGKELVASAIHRQSARGRGPFVAINCAALPEALLESELFGHERGAFSGAIAQKRGRLESADGGTVFLDEIGELAVHLQAKLLRVLQDQVVERIGARRGTKIDVRVVAATNRDLETAIEKGLFRDDLYFRLNVVSLTMPPLRERREDLPLLASYFARQHAARCKRSVKGISTDARKLLMAYDWPGNVRELSNAIERAVVLGSQDVILAEDLPESLLDAGDGANARGFHALVTSHKRTIIREALDQSGGNVAQAARALGLQVTYLHRLIRNLGVKALAVFAAIGVLASCGSSPAPMGPSAAPPPATTGPGRHEVSIAAPGVTIGAYLFRPDRTDPRPAIVVLHGWSPAGTNGAALVEARARRFADEGYIALAMSMRGWPPSGGADDCGLRQPDDVAAVVAWLRTQPGVIADRVAILGFSQGGQVALLTAARDARVAAVVAYFPVTDVARWKTTTDNADIPGYVTVVCEPGGVESRSPIARARDIAAPVLLIHGDADLRVPTQQSQLMHEALLAAGRASELLLVAGAQHGFTAAEEASAQPAADAFFARYLR